MTQSAKHLNIRTSDRTTDTGAQQWKTSDGIAWDGSEFRVGGEAVDYNALVQNCLINPYTALPGYYYSWYPATSKTEQAFKIVGKLLEKKIIEELTVKRFIELVNEIASLI